MHPINAVYFYSCRTFHGLSVFLCVGHTGESCLVVKMPFEIADSCGPKEPLDCTPANTIERPVRGGDAAFCIVTLSTCYVSVSQTRATNQITIGIRLVQKKIQVWRRSDWRSKMMLEFDVSGCLSQCCWTSVHKRDSDWPRNEWIRYYRKTCIIVNRIVLFLCSAALVLSSTPRHTD